MAEYLQEAFNVVCKDAKVADGWYVTLMEETSRFVSPAEGGTYANDTHIRAYQHFSTKEKAEAAYEAVKKLAAEMKEQALRQHGEQCLREMDWLEDRLLEPDYLPEPDGPSNFFVMLTETFPEETRGPTHYE